jgi:hypothetical protein
MKTMVQIANIMFGGKYEKETLKIAVSDNNST